MARRTGRSAPPRDGTRTGRPGAVRLSDARETPRHRAPQREALTRGPNPGRRDRAEPLARPTRRAASREGRGMLGLKHRAIVVAAAMVATMAMGSGVAADTRGGDGAQVAGLLFRDMFTHAEQSAENWTFHNREGRIADGRLWIDGGYTGDAVFRDGWAFTHVGDTTWRDYTLDVTYDTRNVGGLSGEPHGDDLLPRGLRCAERHQRLQHAVCPRGADPVPAVFGRVLCRIRHPDAEGLGADPEVGQWRGHPGGRGLLVEHERRYEQGERRHDG